MRLTSGIARALVAIGMVDTLCHLLLHQADLVRGAAAISLGHFTKLPLSRRQLLKRCTKDPFLVDVLQFYNDKKALAQDFVDGLCFFFTSVLSFISLFHLAWHHCRMIGLPPIQQGRLSLLNAEQGPMQFRAQRNSMANANEQNAIDNVAKANDATARNEGSRENSENGEEDDTKREDDDVSLPVEMSADGDASDEEVDHS